MILAIQLMGFGPPLSFGSHLSFVCVCVYACVWSLWPLDFPSCSRILHGWFDVMSLLIKHQILSFWEESDFFEPLLIWLPLINSNGLDFNVSSTILCNINLMQLMHYWSCVESYGGIKSYWLIPDFLYILKPWPMCSNEHKELGNLHPSLNGLDHQ